MKRDVHGVLSIMPKGEGVSGGLVGRCILGNDAIGTAKRDAGVGPTKEKYTTNFDCCDVSVSSVWW